MDDEDKFFSFKLFPVFFPMGHVLIGVDTAPE